MKLKKEFSDFYSAIRIDSESQVLRQKEKYLKTIFMPNYQIFSRSMIFQSTKVIFVQLFKEAINIIQPLKVTSLTVILPFLSPLIPTRITIREKSRASFEMQLIFPLAL